MNTTARQIALLSLCRSENDGKYTNLENNSAIKKFDLKGAEKKLYTKLFYGTVEKKVTLDHIIGILSSRAVEDMTVQMRNILRMSIYQLRYLDRIPAHSAVNEGVELAKKYVGKQSAPFVNAILREYLRREGKFDFPSANDDYIKYLCVTYSLDEGVARALLSSCGDECEKMLRFLDKNEQYITLRVNTLKTERSHVINILSENGIKCAKTEQSPYGVRIMQSADIPTLERLVGDLAFVEDEASQIAVSALDVQKGMTVFDVCAAPGGKSLCAAIAMENEGSISSYDLHENKIGLIKKAAEKAGIDIIHAEVRDGRIPPCEEFLSTADRVICDVPCSGLGVIGKKPDLRYKDMSSVDSLLNTQYEILSQSVKYLKAGGRLLYSTCTLNKAENSDTVEKFLKENTAYKLIKQQTLMPHTDGTDGFYIAVIEKI